tara:strand:- start:118 stop:702 length:585 start_codon:yes stop_codon:yes gene_type:complete
MNKKTLIQIVLLSFLLIISVSFYYNYFSIDIKADKKEIKNNVKSDDQNLIKDLSYFSKDIHGNEYIIKAKTGMADIENPNLINLQSVNAKIKFDKKNEIIITSHEAIYNNTTYNTKFSGDVLITFEDQIITCDFMEAKLSENIAIISGNIFYKNYSSEIYADKIEFNLLDRSSKISMFNENEKIKINFIKDGIN